MATTFLQAVNEILVESNEVTLTSSNFANAVGVHLYAKNAINRAYLEICAKEEEWPFLAAASSNTNDPYAGNVSIETTAGTRWYLLKTGATSVGEDFSKIDWDSFFITTEGVAGASTPYEHSNLTYTPFNEWVKRYRVSESADASGNQEYAVPDRVFESPDGRYFGLSGIPNKAYKIYFSAWIQPSRLSLYNDTILIPDMYMPVLYHRARYYFHFFKKDYQEATLADRAYKDGLEEMRRGLIGNQHDYMRDDRIRR